MATTKSSIPSLASIRDKIANDISRLKIRAGVSRPNISPGSESYVKAESIASALLELHAKIAVQQDAVMPDTAEGDDLTRIGEVWLGKYRSAGAGATGNITVSCTGTVVFAVGQECTTDDGLRYAVVSTTSVTNGGTVPVQGADVGKKTDKLAGTATVWTSPPASASQDGVVAPGGLTNGVDADTDSYYRADLLYAFKHPALSGSWAHYAKWAEDASSAIERAFIYPAAQGPASLRVAIAQAASPDSYYTRETASLANVAAIAIVSEHPEHANVTVTTVADQETNAVLRITLPEHKVDGGPGGGWLNPQATRWPSIGLTTPYATRLSIAPISGTVLRVTTYSVPISGAYVAIWSNSKKRFEHARVLSATLISGTTYDITFYAAVDTSVLASGDYISPDAERMDDYGEYIAKAFAVLGPGELTATAALLPRAYRHPLNTEAWPSKLTSKHIGNLSNSFSEIEHCSVTTPTLPATPTVAAAVTDPPNILVLGRLALYPSA